MTETSGAQLRLATHARESRTVFDFVTCPA
jgi:hypothetical protein